MGSEVKVEERISFRWGIPWLDQGWVQVPCLFFRHYAAAGVSRGEFLMTLHLASYKYESAGGAARPSLRRIAEEMGCTKRYVQELRRSLEEKGYLEVTSRLGKPSEYKFRGLAEALVEVERGVNSSSPHELQFTPGVNSGSPEEEEQQEEHTAAADQSSMELLQGVGMAEVEARRWAAVVDPAEVAGWVEYAQRPGAGMRNVPGFLVSRFRAKEKAPVARGREEDRARYIEGPYADLIEH